MKTYLLLAAALFTSLLQAQEVVLFDDTQEQTLVYRYHHLTGPSTGSLQQIIRCLAPEQLNQAAFDLTYNYQLQILESTEALKICINWQSISVDRELRPLGFPFAHLLEPAGATFNLELLADGEVVKSECIQQQFGSSLPGYSYNFTDIQGGVYYTLRVNDLHFNYSTQEVQAVRNRKNAIDQYVAAKLSLYDLHLQLEQLRQTEVQPQHLPSYRQQLSRYQQELQQLGRAPFWNILGLNASDAHDPEEVHELLTACRADVQALQLWLNDLAANLHVLYFEQGVSLFEDGQRHAAREAFCASLRTSDCYAPSHYFIAFLDFEARKVEPAAQRIHKVLNQYNPDPAIRTDAQRLASGIVRYYLDAGQHAVALRQYPEGVALYTEALQFSESIRGFDFGQAEAISRIQEAYYLDFHEQIDQVVYTQNAGQYALALQKLENAMAFQQRFKVNSTVNTSRLATDIVNALYNEQLEQIRQLRRGQEWEQAMTAIVETESLLNDYPNMVSQPQTLESEKKLVLSGKFQSMLTQTEDLISQRRLDQALQQAKATDQFAREYQLEASMQRESQRQILRVQQLRYERFVRGGNQAKNADQYAQALEQYNEARRLEQDVPELRTDPNLNNQISATALAEANRLFEHTMTNSAQDNDIIRSRKSQIAELTQQYQLTDNTQVQNIQKELADQMCVNARNILLPQQEQQLARQQQDRDYIAARATIASIQNLLDTYSSCGLSNASLLMNQTVVEACADYQEKLRAAETAEQQRQFGRAIESYLAAADAYQNASVQARLAGHPAFRMESYLYEHTNYRMQVAGAHYYLDQREHEKSLGLLQLVITQGVEPKATTGLQERLGSALAVRHYTASANWKQTFYGFIEKDQRKPYRSLQRSFRKRWKRMA